MDYNQLIELITAKVMEKVSDAEDGCGTYVDKPKLFVLTSEHGESCHRILENEKIKSQYDTQCALLSECSFNVKDVNTIVAFNFTNEALSKVAQGIGDDEYTRCFCKAILLGKRIIVPNCEVELYSFKETAPEGYYNMMLEKVAFLKQAGVVFCNFEDIEGFVCSDQDILPRQTVQKKSNDNGNKPKNDAEIVLSKKVITERDIVQASREGGTCFCIPKKSIITDLAKDAIAERSIKIVRI